jgi:hypothetical protein
VWFAVNKGVLSEILSQVERKIRKKTFRTYYMKKADRKKEEGQTFSPIRRCSPAWGRG